jgi:hypothetical protein
MKNYFFEKHNSMKTRFFSISITVIIIFFSCERNDTDNSIKKEDIFGKWINLENTRDTLSIGDSIIVRTDTLSDFWHHYYKYLIENDSIILQYTGMFEIGVGPFRTKIMLLENNSEISIENLSNYYPKVNGNIFRKIK